MCAPLTALVSPKKRFVWTLECWSAFNAIRRLLMTPPMLQVPDLSAPFSIEVDASDNAMGAVLLQESTHDVLYPVCYMSAKFKPHQRHYATIGKRRHLPYLIALEKFSVYISNDKFPVTVYNDHNHVKFVNRVKKKNNLEIKHIKGKDNMIAAALSRI